MNLTAQDPTKDMIEQFKALRTYELSAIKKPIIQITDDDKADALLLERTVQEAFSDIGCEVLTANSGITAVDMVKASRPIDLVLLDLNLKMGESGAEVFGKMKRLIPGQHIAIVTGHSTPELEEAARKNACVVLRKPVTAQQIRGLFDKDKPL